MFIILAMVLFSLLYLYIIPPGQSHETLINSVLGVSTVPVSRVVAGKQKRKLDSVEISRVFHWKSNMRAKRFYSVGLFLHNCCHLYLYGAFIVFGCSMAVRNAVLMTSSSVTITSASRWSGSATARRTARWAKTKGTAKEQVTNRNSAEKIDWVGLLNTFRSKKLEVSLPLCSIAYWRKSFILSRSDSGTGEGPSQEHVVMRRSTA